MLELLFVLNQRDIVNVFKRWTLCLLMMWSHQKRCEYLQRFARVSSLAWLLRIIRALEGAGLISYLDVNAA